MSERVKETTLPADFLDGQVLYGADVNKIISVLREAVNFNKYDIDKAYMGEMSEYVFVYYQDMLDYLDTKTPMNGQYAIVLRGDDGSGNNTEDTVVLYQYDDTSSSWVFKDRVIGIVNMWELYIDYGDRMDTAESNISDLYNVKEDKSNKVIAWQALPDNVKYPSEKLVKDNLDTKVDKTTTIAGIDLQNSITISELTAALNEATTLLAGTMSAEDKKHLDDLYAVFGETADTDTLVNTITEILDVFSTYPEGVDIANALSLKVNTADIVNDLTTGGTTVPLSAEQGKTLKGLIDNNSDSISTNETNIATNTDNIATTEDELNATKMKVLTLEKENRELKAVLNKVNINQSATTDTNIQAKVDSLAETVANAPAKIQVDGLTLTQGITGGDFDDASKWLQYSTTLSVSNNVGGFTATAINGSIYQNISNYIAGNKYYYQVWVKATSSDVRLKLYDGVNEYYINHSGSGNWELLQIIATLDSSATTFYVYIQDHRISGWDEIQVKQAMVIPLTNTRIHDWTADDIAKLGLPYWEGTQSVVNPVVKTVGRNLFDETLLEQGDIDSSGVNKVSTLKVRSNYILIDENRNYYIKSQDSNIYLGATYYYDYNKTYISRETTAGQYLTPIIPNGAVYVRFTFGDPTFTLETTVDDVKDANIMLNEGTTAFTYEAYNSQVLQIPGTFRSVGENVYDKVKQVNNELVKEGKVSVFITLDGTENWAQSAVTSAFYLNGTNLSAIATNIAFVSDNANVGNIYSPDYQNGVVYNDIGSYDDVIYINVDSIGIKDTDYADVTAWKSHLANLYSAGTPVKFMYELAEPTTEPIPFVGNLLNSLPAQTIIQTSKLQDANVYDGGIDILLTDSPIDSVTKLVTIDFETTEETEVSLDNITVASDGLSFTSTDLSDGDFVYFEYETSKPNFATTMTVTTYDSRYVFKDGADGKYYEKVETLYDGVMNVEYVEVK